MDRLFIDELSNPAYVYFKGIPYDSEKRKQLAAVVLNLVSEQFQRLCSQKVAAGDAIQDGEYLEDRFNTFLAGVAWRVYRQPDDNLVAYILIGFVGDPALEPAAFDTFVREEIAGNIGSGGAVQ